MANPTVEEVKAARLLASQQDMLDMHMLGGMVQNISDPKSQEGVSQNDCWSMLKAVTHSHAVCMARLHIAEEELLKLSMEKLKNPVPTKENKCV
jgi:hypothetical protein